jgi:acyl-CoA reductase-like NAD-dependent aldehyde dehydrogenase
MKNIQRTSGLLIGGELRPASDGATFNIYSPATSELVGVVANATSDDVEAAVDAASLAFKSWSALPAVNREATIRQATAFVRKRADDIGLLMAMEQGKPLVQSRSEIIASCDTIDYYAAEAVRIEGKINPTEHKDVRSWVVYQPVGVCGLITPWNYPVSLLSWKLGPALAAGCTVVVKPTPVTPMSPSAFCAALFEGGIPPGVINVTCGGIPTGAALIEHPGVAKIAMTGSSETGKKLMQAAGKSLKRISLELGGHCPAIVCADADLDIAAKAIAYKGFRNMGQSCSSINRVYAQSQIHDLLVEKVAKIAAKLTIGDGISDESVDLGPMTTADALLKVQRHVIDAMDKGAKLVIGGKQPAGEQYARGNFYLPTVLTEAKSHMLVMNEETFGPVVPFKSFDDIDEAVREANDTSYGLVSYLFTRDFATTIRVSEALEAGTVCVNTVAVNTNYGPYAGWKDSGYGVELSRDAVFEYLKPKHIKVQLA